MEQARKANRVRFGIQARVLALAILFTLLAAVIVTASSVKNVSDQLRRSTLQSTEYALQTASEAIRQDIAEIDGLASWSVTDASVRMSMLTAIPVSTLTHTVYPIISNKYNSMRTAMYIQRFLILSSGGRTVMLGTATNQSRITDGAVQSLPGLGEGDPPVQWDRIVDDPLMQPGVTLSGIPITHSMSSGDGGYSASVYLSISPALITDALKGLSLEPGAWLCWVMGGVMYRVDSGALVEIGTVDQLPPPDQETHDTLDAGTLLYSIQSDGVDCSMVMCSLNIHDLYLASVLPNAALEQPLSQLLSSALTTLVVLLVMGLVMAALLHRAVAAPIGALQRQMETVSQGDFSVNPDIEWDHELGDVGRGINALSRSVSSLMEKRIEDEQQRLALEYQMLQNQISPHFIYNTLNSIKWMATIQHAPGVAEMVTALSRLLKSVSKGTQRLVPLEEEFALLEDYFTIQRYRYGGTITLEMLSPEDVSLTQGYLIPRFSLQPLAENAIFHGIEPKGGVGKLSVTMERSPEGSGLLIRLTDDGVGMTEEQIQRLLAGPGQDGGEPRQFRHVGLWNVHRLLQLSFGPDYGLTVRSAPGEGTTITMRLPEHPHERSGENV